MAKHLVSLDEEALSAAQAELGTTTIKETVNQALRLAARERGRWVSQSLDTLARTEFLDREEAWR